MVFLAQECNHQESLLVQRDPGLREHWTSEMGSVVFIGARCNLGFDSDSGEDCHQPARSHQEGLQGVQASKQGAEEETCK